MIKKEEVMIDKNSTSYIDGYNDAIQGKRDMSERYAIDDGFVSGSNYAAGYRLGDHQGAIYRMMD
jgi:hypothetical protein